LLDISDLDMSTSLPKLHPLCENPYRHFIQDSPVFKIERRLRPTQHGEEYLSGNFAMEAGVDFPYLGNWWNETGTDAKAKPSEWEMKVYSPAEMESMERHLWLIGKDVESLDSGNLYDWYTPKGWLRRKRRL
jgi:hypothetical protein